MTHLLCLCGFKNGQGEYNLESFQKFRPMLIRAYMHMMTTLSQVLHGMVTLQNGLLSFVWFLITGYDNDYEYDMTMIMNMMQYDSMSETFRKRRMHLRKVDQLIAYVVCLDRMSFKNIAVRYSSKLQ